MGNEVEKQSDQSESQWFNVIQPDGSIARVKEFFYINAPLVFDPEILQDP